ncbi:DUF6804 family protein [Humidisolicoccus flavus]|uniref:DUF6804 family protein n=1 Tax=Humidisolicoccus flavus TaxID=3111414 RepID=UPI00324D7343
MAKTPARPSSQTPQPMRRNAFVPGILAMVVIVVGIAILESEAYLLIRFLVTIFALIIAVFAVQAKQLWWAAPMAVIAVLWNPAFPIELDPTVWMGAQYLAILAFGAAGLRIKQPFEESDLKRKS